VHYRSVDDMNRVVMAGLARLPRASDIDLVVGIPRSGLLAANLLALYLNRPLTDLAGLAERRVLSTGKRFVPGKENDPFAGSGRILVVDDCISQGTELRRARSFVADLGLLDRALFVCVFGFPERAHEADVVFEVVPRPMCFEWSCMHTRELANHCVDIDGILCLDPTREQDDDGPRYRRFLRDAPPVFTPSVEIGHLVTCRLERYREETEDWLARHGIRYRNLVMMPHASKAVREQAGDHAEFKARAYLASGASLFLESSPGLARKIAELTGKPVVCLGSGLIARRPFAERLDVLDNRVRFWIRRLRRAPAKLTGRLLGRR
jgi:uncharacterized HAD superfamily protein